MKRRIIFLTATIFALGITKQSDGGINCANAPNRVIVTGPKYVEVNKSATYTCTVDTQGGTFTWTHPGFSNPQITTSGNTSTLVVQSQGTPSTSTSDKKRVKCVYTRPEGVCDGYVDAIIFKIALDKDLWWFKNENPQGGYNISATLSVQPMSTGTFKWDVTAGTSKVDLNNGGISADSITATDDNTILVKSTAASVAATTVTKDTTIKLTYNSSTVVCSYDLAVFSPHSLKHLGNIDHNYGALPPPYPNNPGYWCEIKYEILDQFGGVLPHNVPWNEDFNKDGQSAVSGVSDFAGGDNWGWGPESGWSVPPSGAIDNLARCQFSGATPPVQNLGSGSVKVDHVIGAWYIGSTTIGKGVLVKDNCKWQMYQDHARHE